MVLLDGDKFVKWTIKSTEYNKDHIVVYFDSEKKISEIIYKESVDYVVKTFEEVLEIREKTEKTSNRLKSNLLKLFRIQVQIQQDVINGLLIYRKIYWPIDLDIYTSIYRAI